MPINEIYLAPFYPEKSYHIFNRTNNKELLFHSDENKRHFLKEYNTRLGYLLDTYAWSLLPNHFHLEVKMRPEEFSKDWLYGIPKKNRTLTESQYLLGELPYDTLVHRAFRRFFQSYAMAKNIERKRNGNLFSRPFRCTEIENDDHFKKVMLYIHTNPIKHGISKDLNDYTWTSWHDYKANTLPPSIRNEVYKMFGNKQAFFAAHEAKQIGLLDLNFENFW